MSTASISATAADLKSELPHPASIEYKSVPSFNIMGQITEEKATEKKSCPFPVSCCGNKMFLLEVDDATGFLMFRFGNGAVVMSNVFLSAALIALAKRHVGCNDIVEEGEEEEKCMGQIYGFRPSSLITIIATISGLLSAFLLPIIGAVVDYTKYRRITGAIFATLLIAIQAIQIGTVQATWFVMAILQAINGFFYQALTLVAYAYLPEIRNAVGDATMTTYSSQFYMWMFGIEIVYLIVVIGIGIVLDADDPLTGRLGQAIDAPISGLFYALGFYFFSNKESKRSLPEGTSLITAGFKQVFVTSKGLIQHYPSTLTWFLLAVTFAEAAINSFTTVAVTFLVELGFSGVMSGLVFIEVLVMTIPGGLFATFMTNRMSPTVSMKINLVVFIVVNFVSFLLLGVPSNKNLTWVFGAVWGFMLGWFYPTELNIFSSLMPKGQEAELAGFYLYCTQILGWLPPLVFTLFNESPSIDISWGGVQLNIYILIAAVFYQLMPSWDKCLEITDAENKILKKEDTDAA